MVARGIPEHLVGAADSRRSRKAMGSGIQKLLLEMSIASLDSNELVRLLAPIGVEIGRVIDEADEIGEEVSEGLSGEEEADLEAWLEDERSYIEDLLGLAYVSCQIYIVRSMSEVRNIRKMLGLDELRNWEIMACCSVRVAESAVSGIQLINAAANYFKHSSEWSRPWSELSGRQRQTAEVLEAAGCSAGCTGNMRIVAERLGNERYSNTLRLAGIVGDWTREISNAHRQLAKER